MRRFALAALLPVALPAQSAPISDVHYDVTVDSSTAARRDIDVSMRFKVGSDAPIVLSLPAWSPGHYVLLWFARRVSHFAPSVNGKPLDWRMVDYQTWRLTGAHTGQRVTVQFSYRADTIDRAVAWTKLDFAFFNGTNLFLYPKGQDFDWPATVTIHTSPGWRIATGMDAEPAPPNFGAKNYHDLTDSPVFVGHFDIDSTLAAPGHYVRFVSYPAGVVDPTHMTRILGWLNKLAPVEGAVFHDIPWRTYTVLQIADAHPNGGGLEHHDSQTDEIAPDWLDLPFLAGLYSHEMFHSWNVKRLRPADLVPYRYDDAQPTQWLWVSEGITDYYSYLANMRSGISDSAAFLDRIAQNIAGIAQQPPTALADASLQPWIDPTDGSAGIYYPKGALAGFMLDLMIRDASDNHHSLDGVMRTLYETTYKQGKGFTPTNWWTAVSQAAGGRSFDAVNRRFIEGRDPYPWDSVLALAGLKLTTDSTRDVRFGIQLAPDSQGIRVTYVMPNGAADRAGVKQGDVLVSLGNVVFSKYPSLDAAQAALRSEFSANTQAPYSALRAGQTLNGTFPVEFRTNVGVHIAPVPGASDKAARIRHALFTGTP
ncbi:MAG TPA: PDZ domain-containing protein [Gemmatimonadaceae bacterium]|nr:PDZ domain-containing protein [Gemmatimonadaceae bacterium]